MAAITAPDALQDFDITTVTFEDIAGLDGKEFGFQAGQPYANVGLSITWARVLANGNLASSSGGVAITSVGLYVQEHSTSLGWWFSNAQRAVGFFYRDSLATSVRLLASDANGNVIEQHTFSGGAGYAGFIRPSADIVSLQVLAPHSTYDDVVQSQTCIDDLSFARKRKSKSPIEAGAVVIVLGGIRADGGGIVIGPHGVTRVPPSNPAFQQVAVAANLLAQAELIGDIAFGEKVKRSALLLMRESIDEFFRGE